ncbi:jg14495 [Pararge aegeria aegeria]|uniref:Jg14495 protein n=1 Tax=Pararge aegeria aegeria TaxID=348720 RepID=A0A8S4S0H8_9NEOP|nr:jg14495 [Pararge aegeria aegeria]
MFLGGGERIGSSSGADLQMRCRLLRGGGHAGSPAHRRRDNDFIERLVVQGRIEGTRSRGRSHMRWAGQIKAAVAVPLQEKGSCHRGVATNSQACHNP